MLNVAITLYVITYPDGRQLDKLDLCLKNKKEKKAVMYSICTVNLLFSRFIINAPLSYVSSPDELKELAHIKQYMIFNSCVT